ncbi:alpha beta hydrolase family domain-containing protein [Fusarium circinatum]|uniref:Alpha beta hydrolase family domain-containing protein n=1 Tax=Fusarium circinatum TaxID=48490 RepID=A0A8H5SWJ8_FUSCI|nr:alpha beta hydrolase family domain-containing protein [Fusarium circinatum]
MPTQSPAAHDGLEPRFSLPPTTPRSSKSSFVVGGVQIYLYGLEDLDDSPSDDIAVLYLAHNRTRTYLVTEGIAHEILHMYRTDGRRKRMPMIAVTMNMRNHGDREIDQRANETWSSGNKNHGIDLMSMISGSAQDFKLILDYLPAYLPRFCNFHNIMLGVSLGGHTAWRMASVAPGQIEAFAIVVGCPNLTSLLLSRLGLDAASLGIDQDELDKVPYDELEKVMSQEQRRRWPRALAELVREGDRKARDEFPRTVPLLMCNGKLLTDLLGLFSFPGEENNSQHKPIITVLMEKLLNKVLYGSSSPQGSSSNGSQVFTIRLHPQDDNLLSILPSNAPKESLPLYTIYKRPSSSTLLMHRGHAAPENIIASATMHLSASHIDVSVFNQPMVIKNSSMTGSWGFHTHMGKFKWKVNQMTGTGFELYDQSGRKVAKYGSAGWKSLTLKSEVCQYVAFHVVSLFKLRINLAGTPPTNVSASTSLITTAPAATVAPLPIVTPGNIVARAPIQQSASIRIGSANDVPCASLRLCVSAANKRIVVDRYPVQF